MFNFVFGATIMFFFGLTLMLVILAIVYRKIKVIKWIFGSLATICFIIPIVAIGLFVFGENQQVKTISGIYIGNTEELGIVEFNLKIDQTYELTFEKCGFNSKGTWEYQVGDLRNYIQTNVGQYTIIESTIIIGKVHKCGIESLVLEKKDLEKRRK